MRYPFLAGAAVIVMTAALAACGSSSDGDGDRAGAAPAGRPSPTAPYETPGATASGVPADGAGSPDTATSEPPKIPTDELTPATGTFTRKQKKYLADRVPKGMDPAAVLQTGQETCDKLTYLVKVDRDTAVIGIVTGEITGAAPAVENLCTRHRDLVEEAAHGYADGTFGGKEVRPGRYRAPTPTRGCAWQITGAGGRTLVSGRSDGPARVTVPKAARAFTSTGCYAWLPEGDAG